MSIDTGTNIELGNDPNGQLYDLSVDIGETHNVAGQHPDVVATLAARLQQIKNRASR